MSPDSVAVGDIMQTVNPEGFEPTEHEVTYSETKPQPCVEIITESGATLKCSTSAPILTSEGEQCDAAQLLGRFIPYKDGDKYEYTLVSEVRDIGEQLVQHITCGNQYFLAGGGNGLYLLHHNVKMQVDGARQNAIMRMDDNNNQFLQESNGFGGGATRGAMQANGTWDAAHGGTASNPATQWGQNMQDNTQQSNSGWNGQLIDPSYSGQAAPSAPGTAAANLWGSVGGVGNYTPPNFGENMPPPMPTQAPSGSPSGGSSAGSGVVNWIDNHAGNFYDENSGKVNKLNTTLGALSMITGLPIQRGAMALSKSHLMNGSGGDWARTQMQQQYDRSNPQQQQQFINSTAEKYNTTPENVRGIIGRQ